MEQDSVKADGAQKDAPIEKTEHAAAVSEAKELEKAIELPCPPSSWEEWCKLPLPETLTAPYPLFSLTSEVGCTPPSVKKLEKWRGEKSLAAIWHDCTEISTIKGIAKRFVKCFGETPAKPHGILLKADKDSTFWLVGDVHGNAEGLMNAYAFVWAQAQKQKGHHTIILLGDIIDRGDNDLEALALVESLLLLGEKAPVPVVYVCGNHDAGLYRREDGTFASSVDPAETTERLNAMEDKEVAALIGQAAILLAKNAPCVGEITGIHLDAPEKTLLFTHGGVPHVDLQEKACSAVLLGKDAALAKPEISTMDAIEAWPDEIRQACSRDYVWVRIVDKLPHKIPNRGSSGCQIGTDDVNQFRKIHYAITGRAVSFIVRGHDHEDDGFRLYSAQEGINENKRLQANCGVLTINAMDADDMAPERKVCVLRCHQGEPLSLFKMGAEEDDCEQEVDEQPEEDLKAVRKVTEQPKRWWECWADCLLCRHMLAFYTKMVTRVKSKEKNENQESED